MKTVRIKNGAVVEIIPEYALPVEKWYNAEFAKECMEAPDEVQQGWRLKNGVFVDEPEPVKKQPTQLDEIQAQVAYTAMKTGTLVRKGG